MEGVVNPKKEDSVLYPAFRQRLALGLLVVFLRQSLLLGVFFSPRTYASRKSEAGDPVAKNRSAIFLISARRSPVERGKA